MLNHDFLVRFQQDHMKFLLKRIYYGPESPKRFIVIISFLSKVTGSLRHIKSSPFIPILKFYIL